MTTLLFLFSILSILNAQKSSVSVKKNIFSNNKSNIDVEVRNAGKLLDSSGRRSYYYREIYSLEDSLKISVIEKIFEFTSDTSTCFTSVRIYENPDYPGCYIEPPLSKVYPIRIEALFIINRIAYNPFAFRIGCYPVLFDTETLKEINDDNCLINLIIERYREWFKMYKLTGKLPDYEFLNSGRIRWWGKHLQK